ncbi:MAG: hypothetical protein ACK559_03240, partial [bacterium]
MEAKPVEDMDVKSQEVIFIVVGLDVGLDGAVVGVIVGAVGDNDGMDVGLIVGAVGITLGDLLSSSLNLLELSSKSFGSVIKASSDQRFFWQSWPHT